LTEQFVVGLVGAPYGLEGFIKVRPFSGDIDNLLKIREVTVRQHGKEQTLAIEKSTASPPVVLMRFAGVSSPEAAKTLSGAELLVDRGRASPLADGEFYIEDLKGLPVLSKESNEILGHIRDIVEGSGNELVEIKLAAGDIRLIPLLKEFFPLISPESGKVILNNEWILE